MDYLKICAGWPVYEQGVFGHTFVLWFMTTLVSWNRLRPNSKRLKWKVDFALLGRHRVTSLRSLSVALWCIRHQEFARRKMSVIGTYEKYNRGLIKGRPSIVRAKPASALCKALQLNFLPALLGLRETALRTQCCLCTWLLRSTNTRSRDRFRRKTIRFHDRFAMRTPLLQA